MNSDYCTVIVLAADQKAAQGVNLDSAGAFITPASLTGNAPATHYFTSGPWYTTTIADIRAQSVFVPIIEEGEDWRAALSKNGLKMVQNV